MLGITSETRVFLKTGFIDGRLGIEGLRGLVISAIHALWMGHESVQTTQIYLDANLELKEKVLAKVRPHNSKAGRYRPGSQLTAFLASL
jgi:hypothetical protein